MGLLRSFTRVYSAQRRPKTAIGALRGRGRLGIERVGDRDSPIGARPALRGLAIGMIAPDEIAPPGGELGRRLRRPKAELSLDLGGGQPREIGGVLGAG